MCVCVFKEAVFLSVVIQEPNKVLGREKIKLFLWVSKSQDI